ncbi:anti-sigma factor family protein [Chloroflexota bacterium]
MFGIKNKTGCDRVREKLSEYIDGQLAGKDLERVEAHLNECEACTAELAELRTTVAILNGVEDVPPPHSFAIDPAAADKRERQQPYGSKALRWLRPALAVSSFVFVVMLFVDFGTMLTTEEGAGTAALSSGGFDWRFILRIMEWSWGSMIIAFALAFIYVSWRRHRGYPDYDDSNDLLH